MVKFIELDPGPGIVERAAQGDREAHRLIYENFERPVYALIYRLVRSRHVAQELLHDTFIEVLRNCAAYRGSGPFGAWIRSIAIRKCLMHLRSPWCRAGIASLLDEPGSIDAIHDPHARPDAEALAALEVERALAVLPALARAVVWLHDVEGMTHGEIAHLLGRTVSFSKSQLARAHRRLRAILEPDMEDANACTQASPIS
jgi:RNA polymerase sigma-70 factor (ECF subfamily)